MDHDCGACKGTGCFTLTACPKQSINRQTHEFMRFVRLSEHHLPLSGGLLDQTQSFISALDWTTNEKNRWAAE